MRYGEARSTKAGVETPATPCGSSRAPTRARSRSTKAGVETPATPGLAAGGMHPLPSPLNEGRGRDPGDTLQGRRWYR